MEDLAAVVRGRVEAPARGMVQGVFAAEVGAARVLQGHAGQVDYFVLVESADENLIIYFLYFDDCSICVK